MTVQQIKEQVETIEATVSQENANLQEAVQGLASLIAALCEKIRGIHADLEEFHGRANE